MWPVKQKESSTVRSCSKLLEFISEVEHLAPIFFLFTHRGNKTKNLGEFDLKSVLGTNPDIDLSGTQIVDIRDRFNGPTTVAQIRVIWVFTYYQCD